MLCYVMKGSGDMNIISSHNANEYIFLSIPHDCKTAK